MNILTFDIEEWALAKAGGYGTAEKYAEYDSYLNKILDVLDERGFKGTFFCTGLMGTDFPQVIKLIHKRGHEVGCHSFKHAWLNKMTEDEFKTFHEVFRGGQEYRTCQLFFYKDFIVFGTDTQYEQNVIKKFDRKTLEITELQNVQGSVIKGGQVGDVAFISTTVEPSKVNTDKYAHLWVTKDGLHWEERYKAKKDWLPATLFQFGTFEFPQYYGIEKLERLYFSGRALKGLDGKTTYIDLV